MAAMMSIPSSGWRASPEPCHDAGHAQNLRSQPRAPRSFSGSPDHLSNRDAHVHNWNPQPHPHPHQHPRHMHPHQHRIPHHADRETGHGFAPANSSPACTYQFIPHPAEDWEQPASDYPPAWFSPQRRHQATPPHHHADPHNHHHEYHPHAHFTAASATAAGIAARNSLGGMSHGSNLDWAAQFTMPHVRPAPGTFHTRPAHPRGYSPPLPRHTPHQAYNTSAWTDHMAAHAASLATQASSVAAAVAAATTSTATAAVAAAAAAGLTTAAAAFSSAAKGPRYNGPDWPPTKPRAAAATTPAGSAAAAAVQPPADRAENEDEYAADDVTQAALLIQRVWRGTRLSRHHSAISTLAFIQSSAQEAMLWLKRVCADGAAFVDAGEDGVQAWLRSLYPKKMAEVDEIAISGFLELDRLCGLPWELKAIRRELARQLLSLQDTLAEDNREKCADPGPDLHHPSADSGAAHNYGVPVPLSPSFHPLTSSYFRSSDPIGNLDLNAAVLEHLAPPSAALPIALEALSPRQLAMCRATDAAAAVAAAAASVAASTAAASAARLDNHTDVPGASELTPLLDLNYQASGMSNGRISTKQSGDFLDVLIPLVHMALSGGLTGLPGFPSSNRPSARLPAEPIYIDLSMLSDSDDDEESAALSGSPLSQSGDDSFYASLFSAALDSEMRGVANEPGLGGWGSEVCVQLGPSGVFDAVNVGGNDEKLLPQEDTDLVSSYVSESSHRGDFDEMLCNFPNRSQWNQRVAVNNAVAAAAAGPNLESRISCQNCQDFSRDFSFGSGWNQGGTDLATADAATIPTSPSRTSSGWSLIGPVDDVEDGKEDVAKDGQEDEEFGWTSEDEESLVEEDEQSVDAEESDDSAGSGGLGGFDWEMGTMTATAPTALFTELQHLPAHEMATADLDIEDEDRNGLVDFDVGSWNACCDAMNDVSPAPLLSVWQEMGEMLMLSKQQRTACRYESLKEQLQPADVAYVAPTAEQREQALIQRVAILEAQVHGLLSIMAAQQGQNATAKI